MYLLQSVCLSVFNSFDLHYQFGLMHPYHTFFCYNYRKDNFKTFVKRQYNFAHEAQIISVCNHPQKVDHDGSSYRNWFLQVFLRYGRVNNMQLFSTKMRKTRLPQSRFRLSVLKFRCVVDY